MVSFQSSPLLAIAALALVMMLGQVAQASRAHNGFFQSLTEEQKEQVSEILHSGKSKAEIREQLRHWVSSQPAAVQEAFKGAEKSQETRRQRVHAKRQQLLSKVSAPAKELDNKIKGIYQDQKLTKDQTCQKVSALIKAASAQVKQELKLKDIDCDE